MPSSLPPGVPEGAPSIGDGRYALVARIGEGGMAGVYRAWDHRLRVFRAVKVMFPEYAKRKKIRQRFETEAHTMARLEHQHLVRIYDVGDAGALPFIVMELVTGGTLIHWLARNGPMSPRMACDVLLQVCQGVIAAHEAGVVHRDIKPHNVLISPSGQCKLTDFGIAQADDVEGLTKTGSAMGTMGYMAPEQRNDAKSVDRRADIFSLGATLWTLLAAEPANDLFVAHENPKMLAPVPPELRPAILKCVAYDREQRYGTVHELVADLRAAMDALPEDPPYGPDLVLDLTEEEPLDGQLDFPEIRALLDGASAEREPQSDEGLQPPAASKKALPYYMPTADTDPRRRTLSQHRAEADDDDLPDYIDRGSYGGGGDDFVIGVDSAHVRSEDDAPPARPEPEERPSYLDYEREEESPSYLDEPEEEPDRRDPTEEEPAPPPRARQAPRSAPRSAPPPPPAPTQQQPEKPDDEGNPLVKVASLAVGGMLALGTVVVVLLMLVFGYQAYQLYDVASTATGSRQQLYNTLTAEREIILTMGELGGDRIALEDAYMAWMEQRGEPGRYRAAQSFLVLLDAQSAQLLTEEGSATQRDAEHRVRRIRSARKQYEADEAMWDQRASSLLGRILITVGAGSGPPK